MLSFNIQVSSSVTTLLEKATFEEVYENSDTDFSKLHEQMWKPFIPVPNQDKCIQTELETLTKNLPYPSLEFLQLVKNG